MKFSLLFILIICSVFVSAANFQASQPSFQSVYNDYSNYYGSDMISYQNIFPILSDENCQSRQDFLVNVRPASCSPSVVRSDLLEEQNVPVFCKLDAIKINPLIEVASIKSVGFKGSYAKEVAGVSFHPSKAALRIYNKVLESPLINDVGYVVVILKQTTAEKNMPESVEVNLTAILKYDMDNIFGSGKPTYYLPVLEDSEWDEDYKSYNILKGNAFLRVNSIEKDQAEISIYTDKDRIYRTVLVNVGHTSDIIYAPGFYCSAGIKIKLNDISNEKSKAKILVDNDEVWVVENEKILNNACLVKKIENYGSGSGKVTLNCKGKNIELEIGLSNKLYFKLNNQITNSSVGEKIKVNEDYITPLYLGKDNDNLFVILSNVSASKKQMNEILVNIASWKKEKADWKLNVREKIAKKLGANIESVQIVFPGEEKFKLIFMETSMLDDKVYDSKVESYFSETEDILNDIVEVYSSEKQATGVYYSAQALWEFSLTAEKLGKSKTQNDILNKLVEKYPETNFALLAKERLSNLNLYDYSKSGGSIFVGSNEYYFKLLDVKSPSLDKLSAEFEIDGEQKKFSTQDYVISDSDEYVKIISLDDEYITVEHVFKSEKEKTPITKVKTVKVGDSLSIDFDNRQTAVLRKINIQKSANIELISTAKNGYSETNFTVRIGIEKRAIELSPNKTIERINNLNESIKKFEKLTEKIGNMVKVWKGTCLGVTAGLIAWNFFENIDGEGIARKTVMDNYWKQKCSEEVGAGSSSDLDACYMKYNKEIAASVEDVKNAINENNEVMKTLSKDAVDESYFGLEKNANTEKLRVNVKESFANYVIANPNVKVNVDGEEKTLGDIFGKDKNTINNKVDSANLGVTEMRDIMFYSKLEGSSNEYSKIIGNKQLDYNIAPIYQDLKSNEFKDSYSEALLNSKLNKDAVAVLDTPGVTQRNVQVQQITDGQISGVSKGDYISLQVPGGTINGIASTSLVLVPVSNMNGNLEPTGDGYIVKSVSNNLEIDNSKGNNGRISVEDYNQLRKNLKIGSFKAISKDSCENKYINAEVKYYETEPYKGMPAVVPIDTKRGWYAATKQSLPGFGAISSYKESGAVSSLWLCNVGRDGKEDWQTSIKDDDPCIQINYETGMPLTQNPCISDTKEAERLALSAKRIVENVASQYGKERIKYKLYNGESFDKKAKPALKTNEVQCQDFLSPEQCTTLFNVCDPVICPTSRCDFGGTFPVDNVVQSGIVGSLLLCLPNFGSPSDGKVVVPVCLTGLHAGLDAYTSILRSHRDCLQENLQSGKMMGICDEIYSIYLCEFFWRQAAPIANQIVPKLIEMITTGGQARGGGEYLTVQDAWENSQKASKYFTDSYGLNAFNAFKARSSDEIGTEICKSFVSTNYPNNFESLIEPESPVQFHATFDEIAFTEATVPAASQYKVYYHIYGGKDSGHYFQIFLKNPPQTGYYSEQATILVDSGYIGIGQSVDLTKDFTAPAGYKELCVRIDSKEECGFKQVSTSFAVNYVKDKIVQEQAEQEVTTEANCVSGTASVLSLANTNIQEGADKLINPAIYERGIIRVCSTDNPGQASNPSRWKDVGYCGNNKIRCWIDEESVKGVVTDKSIENMTLSEIDNINIKNVIKQSGKWDEDTTSGKIEAVKNKIENTDYSYVNVPDNAKTLDGDFADLVSQLNEIEEKAFFNHQKVKAVYMKFNVYNKLTLKLSEIIIPSVVDRMFWNTSSALTKARNMNSDEVDTFLEELVSDNIVSEAEYREIMRLTTNDLKTANIVSLLQKKGGDEDKVFSINHNFIYVNNIKSDFYLNKVDENYIIYKKSAKLATTKKVGEIVGSDISITDLDEGFAIADLDDYTFENNKFVSPVVN